MNTDVSVVIPVYNGLALLGPTLDSILSQTLPPKEVIVVDDGSTEDVKGFLAPYQARGVRCIRTRNEGCTASRRNGAAVAQSPWLAFCDADDLWLPQRLERQFNLLRLAPDCEYCMVDYQNLYDTGLGERSHFYYAPPDFWTASRRDFGDAGFVLDRDMVLDFLTFQPGLQATLLMSRRQYEKIGGWNPDMSRNSAEDFEFHLRSAHYPPLAFVPEVLVHYRRHPANWSIDGLQQEIDAVKILEYMLDHYEIAQQHEARFRAEIESRTLACAERAFYEERLDLFHQHVRRVQWNRRPLGLSARYSLTLLPKPLYQSVRNGVRAINRIKRRIRG